MAILFKSKKNKEKVFTWAVVVLVILILFVVSLFVFPPAFFTMLVDSGEEISGEYNVKINLGAMELEQVKNLEPFSKTVKLDFSYVAQDKKGKQVTGIISASSEQEAITMLTDKGLLVSDVKEAYSVNSDPFTPYFQ